MAKKIVTGVVVGLIVGGILIQFIPYGRDHTNPPVVAEPQWDSQQARDLAVSACYDCHSNQTQWPWYSNIAPVSWLVQHDVDTGRSRLNFSQWNLPQRGAREASRVVQDGRMPQWYYALLHPSASLAPTEKQILIQALQRLAGSASRP